RGAGLVLRQWVDCFVASRWEPRRGVGLVGVVVLGAVPVLFPVEGARLIFASEVVDLLRLLTRRPAPNRRAVVRWLVDGSIGLGETLYTGIRRLPGGHAVRLTDRGWRTQRYWRPSYGGVSQAAPNDYELQVRDAVISAVEQAASGSRRAGI